jgi:hypothetical protein
MSESDPLAACRGCMFAIVIELVATALCLACVALLRALGCC